jgi:uncharacterized membrane protein YeaQ/YmgE (transglycosylase-associated protein family)
LRAVVGDAYCSTTRNDATSLTAVSRFTPTGRRATAAGKANGHRMSILAWIVLGLVAGVVAGKIIGRDEGILGDIVVGVLGALMGGFLFDFFGERGITGFNLWSFMVAIVGSVVLLVLFHAIRAQSHQWKER